MAESRWNPWRALRAREHVRFRLAPLPDATGGGIVAHTPDGARAAIVIDPALSLEERNAALAHELVHDERGLTTADGMPTSWGAVVAREEQTVDRITAGRLVPIDELRQVVDVMLDLHGSIEARHVAEHFEVPEPVARLAMQMLKEAG